MTTTTTIDIGGLSKAQVLAALYNAASPAGMGFINAGLGPEQMTTEQAATILERQTRFDYLHGRSFKIDLDSDDFNPRLYDRDNGGDGTAEMIIERLRQTGAVSSPEGTATREAVTAQHEHDAPHWAELGELRKELNDAEQALWREILSDGILPEKIPAGMTARQHLDWASDMALKFYDNGSNDKAGLAFLELVSRHQKTKWIATHPMTSMLLATGFIGGRAELERAMKGFAV